MTSRRNVSQEIVGHPEYDEMMKTGSPRHGGLADVGEVQGFGDNLGDFYLHGSSQFGGISETVGSFVNQVKANPILFIAAGLAAYYAYKNWDKVSKRLAF